MRGVPVPGSKNHIRTRQMFGGVPLETPPYEHMWILADRRRIIIKDF
jgi:hypothetical protein